MAIGGSGFADFFYMKADHTKVYKTLGQSPTEASDVTDRVIRIGRDKSNSNLLGQTDITINEDGRNLSITWTHTKFDSAFNTFIENVVSRKASGPTSELEEFIDETGVKMGGAEGASSQDVLVIAYGPKDSDGKIVVYAAIGNIVASSGGVSFQPNTFVKPSLSFNSKGCLNASGLDISALIDVYDSSTNPGGIIASSPAVTASIPKDNLYSVFFLDPKS